MNLNQNSHDEKDAFVEEIEEINTLSVDEFFRQLEAREKDLHITSSDTVIEIDDDDDTEETDVDEFSEQEIFTSPPSSATTSNASSAASSAVAVPETPKTQMETFAPPSPAATKAVANLENQVSSLQDQVTKLETERVEMYELTRRRQTDFDTFKKRTERERTETFRAQLGNLATQMLPVLDNLNRALDSVSSYGGDDKPQNFQQFFEGIMLVNQQLGEVLSEMGVQPIAAVGETFDPHFHEAVATEEATDDVPPHTITAELLRGYRIDDRVIRPSMVKVSK